MAISFSTALKWIGYGTAILSFAAGVRGITSAISSRVEVRHKTEALLASERIQLNGHDYAGAWQTLDQASKLAPDSTAIREAQEDLAMDWLDDIRVQGEGGFSEVVQKLDPILTRGIGAAKTPQRQADLTAHLGWSYFLRAREGVSGLDPSTSYADAAKKDPGNPYAEAMWGHWILWNHGDPADAAKHFAAALGSNRERAFVRRLQLSALLNNHDDASEDRVVQAINDIRKESGSVPPDMKRRIFSMYYGKLIPPDEETTRFINAVPPAEHVATFQWMFDRMDLNESESLLREGDLCVLEEAAGQREDAKRGYESIRKKLAGRPGSLLAAAETGSKRLAGSSAQ
ncbi:MAG TPA: hypothetical protein VG273_26385 [Bryobacteraceae bacterium]|jgi:hypothetical protein|nr:hypothetical protein [Bryobacteraceae bacterium]